MKTFGRLRLSVVAILLFVGVATAAITSVAYPLQGSWTVACAFWSKCNPSFSGMHPAEDYAQPAGSPVYAPADGVVKHTREKDKYGNVVIIESQLPDGSYICFVHGHLRPPPVAVGQSVRKGDVIGYLRSKAENYNLYIPHLHFGIHKGAYAGDYASTCNGEWVYGGYTKCSYVKNDWYDPSEFIRNFTASQPPPRNTKFPAARAYASGTGSAYSQAFLNSIATCGGPEQHGFAAETVRWIGDFTGQATYSHTSGAAGILLHDEQGRNPIAFPVTADFYEVYQAAGGVTSTVGPPITCRYQTNDGGWRQDFRRGSIVKNNAGVRYLPYSIAGVGEGTPRTTAYDIAVQESGGMAVLGTPQDKNYVYGSGIEWQHYTGGQYGISSIVLRNDRLSGYWMRDPIRTWWFNNKSLAGEPVSVQFALNGTTERQYFRNGRADVSGGVVTFTTTGTNYTPGEGLTLAQQVPLREAYLRNGGAKVLGMATAAAAFSGNCATQDLPNAQASGGAVMVWCNDGQRAAHILLSSLAATWKTQGGATGLLQRPLTDGYSSGSALRQDFEGGYLLWTDTVRQFAWKITFPGQNSGYAWAFQKQWASTGRNLIGEPSNSVHWLNNVSGTVTLQDFCDYPDACTGTVTYAHDEVRYGPIAFALKGAIREAYRSEGGASGWLGYPITNELSIAGSPVQYFDNGYIAYDSTVNRSRGFTW